jgi:hypothetical protein
MPLEHPDARMMPWSPNPGGRLSAPSLLFTVSKISEKKRRSAVVELICAVEVGEQMPSLAAGDSWLT